MITKSDWEAVRNQLSRDSREKLGELPTFEEAMAYTRGELSDADEAHVRELLVAHPDLLRALIKPFPAGDAEPGDPDFLSQEELDRRWASLQRRVHGTSSDGGRLLNFWRASAALAAALALVMGGLLWKARSGLDQPDVWNESVLQADGMRGPGASSTTLTLKDEDVLLVVPVIGRVQSDRYRLQIVDSVNRSLWRSAVLHLGDSQSFSIRVPRRFLAPGKYQMVLHGIEGTGEDVLATYSLRVVR